MNINNYRYERKFVIKNFTLPEIEYFIKTHPAMFSEIYHQRWVRNIYFDTINFDHYVDNIEGNSERNKLRIRWYGDLFGNIKEPKLELKYKNGLLGYKKYFDINPFFIRPNNELSKINSNLNKSIKNYNRENYDFINYFPVISNSYKRKYFLSSNHLFRITIDSNQSFFRVNNNFLCNRVDNNQNIILELKYDYNSERKVDEISKFFPFRLSKNSKYVEGVNVCYS